jgi:unsaturated rhamnogalacturonyl hydrolase
MTNSSGRKMMRIFPALLAAATLASGTITADAQTPRPAASRPAAAGPSTATRPTVSRPAAQLWSVRMAESVMRRNPVVHPDWDYTAGVVLQGIWNVGQKTGDPRFAAYVRTNMERVVTPDGRIPTYDSTALSLDEIAQGRLLFPLWQTTHDARWRNAAMLLRAQLRRHPRTGEGGFWHKKTYPEQMWLDGLYMGGPFYAQFGQVFREPADFDDVAKQALLMTRHTRDPRTGLLYHGWDAAHAQAWADTATGLSPSFWGRAVGWYAMALVDILDYLPASHPDRPELVRALRDVSAAVTRVQDPVTGLWWQVLDQPNRRGNYLEASASSMFVYALAKGAHKGYLAPEYLDVARRGYDGIVRNLVTVDADGLVSLNGVCQVAGLGGRQNRSGTYAYYISEPVVANDYKGVGPFILASVELGR